MFFSLLVSAKFMRNCQIWKACQQLFSQITETACPVLLTRHHSYAFTMLCYYYLLFMLFSKIKALI